MSIQPMSTAFLTAVFAEIKTGFAALIYLQILRFAFIFSFHDFNLLSASLANFATVALAGLHYDLKLAFVLFLAVFVGSFAAVILPRLKGLYPTYRRVVMTGFILLTTLLNAAAHEFFLEFNSQFDIRVFDGVGNGFIAILRTMVNTYHLLEWVTGCLLLTLLYAIFLHRRFVVVLDRPGWIRRWILRDHALVTFAVIGMFMLSGYLVSFGSLEADDKSRPKFPSKILSAAVMPGPIAIYKAAYEYRRKLRAYQPNLFSREAVKRAVTVLSATPLAGHVDQAFLQRTSGEWTLKEKPKHIFLLVMERYDSWPLQPEYAALNVTNGLKSLMPGGMYFKNFLPGSTTTMPSLQVILFGLPYIDLEAQHFTEVAYPGAIGKQMAALGYKTQFFYGGFLGWSQIGLVARSQGFAAVHGADEQITEYAEKNEWGIDDGSLFKYVAKTVAADPTPSFNLILSTSNHPPYSLDLKRHQVPVEAIGQALDALTISNNTRAANINRMGHLWYADQVMTAFVQQVHKQEPSALFAITGDHFSRAHFHLKTSLYEQSSVPLVLMGPEALAKVKYDPLQPGSHLDIAPTLLELIAPAGYEYFTLGQSLVGSNRMGQTFGAEKTILRRDAIFKNDSPKTAETLAGAALTVDPVQVEQAKGHFQALKLVTWWRMIHGQKL